jgi:hypothetical protein
VLARNAGKSGISCQQEAQNQYKPRWRTCLSKGLEQQGQDLAIIILDRESLTISEHSRIEKFLSVNAESSFSCILL